MDQVMHRDIFTAAILRDTSYVNDGKQGHICGTQNKIPPQPNSSPSTHMYVALIHTHPCGL